MAWYRAEQCFQDYRSIILNALVLLSKIKIGLQHRISLNAVVEEQQCPRIIPDNQFYDPKIKRDWKLHKRYYA